MPAFSTLLARLPVQSAAEALLGPAGLVREGTVVLARTARSWELTLANLAGRELEPGHGAPLPTPAAATVRTAADLDDAVDAPAGPDRPQELPTDVAEPPVDGWAELSAADARSAIAGLADDELAALLAYEQSHGRRMQYVLLLEHRIADSSRAADAG